MKKLLFVFGTRPEAIKLAPVIVESLKRSAEFDSVVALTAQHRSMVDQVMKIFSIDSNHDLNIMTEGQTLSRLTARLVEQLDSIVALEKPDWVVVQGDTTSAMAGAMVAFYHRTKIAHVEAGLRTHDVFRPYPEEFNRRVIDIIADRYFAPTQASARNLLDEGIPSEKVVVTGNTVVDALLEISRRPFDWSKSVLRDIPQDRDLVLVTAHRRESFGEPFRDLCLGIRELSERFPQTEFVYPVHLNPNVQAPVREILAALPNVHLLEPVDYVTLIQLLKSARLVLTDSGGIQEEAPTFKVPVLVMRETTERPEGVEAGFSTLVGANREAIVAHATDILSASREETRLAGDNPYGDGKASSRILESIAGFPDFTLR